MTEFQSLNRDKGRSNASTPTGGSHHPQFQSLNRDKGRSNAVRRLRYAVPICRFNPSIGTKDVQTAGRAGCLVPIAVSIPQSGQRTFKLHRVERRLQLLVRFNPSIGTKDVQTGRTRAIRQNNNIRFNPSIGTKDVQTRDDPGHAEDAGRVSIPQSGQRTFKLWDPGQIRKRDSRFNPSIGTKDVQTRITLFVPPEYVSPGFNPSIGTKDVQTLEKWYDEGLISQVSIPQSGQRTFKRMRCRDRKRDHGVFQSLNRDKGRSNIPPFQISGAEIHVSIPQSGQRTFKHSTETAGATDEQGFNPSIGTKDVQTKARYEPPYADEFEFQSLNRDKGRSNLLGYRWNSLIIGGFNPSIGTKDVQTGISWETFSAN